MSAVSSQLDYFACVDAVYAGDDALSSAPRSAARAAIAEPAPAVRPCDAALAQLERLQSLLDQWISENDAWDRTAPPRGSVGRAASFSAAARPTVSIPPRMDTAAPLDCYLQQVANKLARSA